MNAATPDALMRASLAYASHGWPVLPLWWPTDRGCACGLPDCQDAGKHPVHELVPRGLLDATSAHDTVAGWWTVLPFANVGIRTGAASGLVVLDVDGEAGRRALGRLVATRREFDAAWVRTGRGWHAYLAYPGGNVPSSAGRVGPGLDLRAEAGCVVAPPSRHRAGHVYRWVGHHGAAATLPGTWSPPPAPDWLVRLARPRRWYRFAPMTAVAGGAAVVLETEAREVARATAGQRNHRLNLAAFRLGQLVGAGLIDECTVTAPLVAAGLAAGPGERKIRSTVRRGLEAGVRKARTTTAP